VIVRLEKIWKTYGRFVALRELSFRVPEGSVFALFGANGAGKTTTIRMLMNLVGPTSGDATILGVDTRALSPRELTQIGYVSENQKMPGRMTVAAYIHYLRPYYPSWDRALEAELLGKLHDLQRLAKYPVDGSQLTDARVRLKAYEPVAHFMRHLVIADIRLGDWAAKAWDAVP
jgi:ABC-2 type transport system ATP-binding protein